MKTAARREQQQAAEAEREYSRKAEGSTAGRDILFESFFGTEKGSWEAIGKLIDLPHGEDYLDPRGNHGRHGYALRYIGKTPLRRPDEFVARMVERHGYSPEQAESLREIQPGATEVQFSNGEVDRLMTGPNTLRIGKAAGVINVVSVATKSAQAPAAKKA
jgi:hypothetical protein